MVHSAIFPGRQQRRSPAVLLLVVLPLLLSLSLISYLYLNQLPSMAGSSPDNVTQQHAAMEKHVDLTIVGAGLAGLTASLEAANLDPSLKILLVEKEKKVGGNSAKASSGINAALDAADEPVFTRDTLKSGGGLAVEKIVDTFIPKTPDAKEFLKKYNVDLSVLSQLGGHSAKRTHRNKSGPNIGFAIISTLQKEIVTRDNIEILTGATAKKLLLADETQTPPSVTGVEVKLVDGQTVSIYSKAVILTTGGFSASHKMLKRFSPGMEMYPTTNGVWAQGEGALMSEAIGVDLTLMDKVQLHPTGFINPKDREAGTRFLAPEAIRGSGAVLLNKNGKRFVDELTTRDKASDAILAQPGQQAYMLLFEDGARAMASELPFYKHMGIVTMTKSVAEAAEFCHFDDPQALLKELNDYAEIAGGNQEDPFGKKTFPYPIERLATIDTRMQIVAMEVAPTVHYTMGGVKITENTEVIHKNGEVVPGLFAAGEVSGGLHGANRLGGNSLAECVVFGRVSAQQAISSLRQ
ncbi:FAD binding domain [Phytophthora infestans]|uniref:fumarate reductase (NADH) n=1 Tax=Phytophthora infestans TaxID=4787 RepID=A0A833SVS5_PHYIN|nr:FAD binding domain [Phytophthora infestans]